MNDNSTFIQDFYILTGNQYITDVKTTLKKTPVTLEKINSSTGSRQTQKSPAINMSMNLWPVIDKSLVPSLQNMSLDNELLTNQTKINYEYKQRSAVKNTGNYASVSNHKTDENRTNCMGTPNATLSHRKDLRIVIILAYMHTGSTYTAQMIKNHPGTFYEFEPLRNLQKSSRKKHTIEYLNGATR